MFDFIIRYINVFKGLIVFCLRVFGMGYGKL